MKKPSSTHTICTHSLKYHNGLTCVDNPIQSLISFKTLGRKRRELHLSPSKEKYNGISLKKVGDVVGGCKHLKIICLFASNLLLSVNLYLKGKIFIVSYKTFISLVMMRRLPKRNNGGIFLKIEN